MRVFGADVVRVVDVGVAGLHRVLDARPVLQDADIVIVVAGMEGALPSVIGGLVGTPVVAVNGDGRTAVVWLCETGSLYEDYALMIYDENGAAVAGPTVIGSVYEPQSGAEVSIAPDGSIVVVYDDRWDYIISSVYAARFGPDDKYLGAEEVGGDYFNREQDVAVAGARVEDDHAGRGKRRERDPHFEVAHLRADRSQHRVVGGYHQFATAGAER